MNLSAPFIRRPAGTSLLAAGLLLLGLTAYRYLAVAPVPRVDYPLINIYAGLPGANPATVAASLASPLERRLGQIAGVNEMTSVSTMGGVSITLQFDLNRSVDGAARDVQAAINAAAADLPSYLPAPPTYYKVNPADAPIMVIAITSDVLKPGRVYELADNIVAQRLSRVEGVSQVFLGGSEKPSVRIQADPFALASAGVSLEDIRASVAAATANSPKGSVEGHGVAQALTANDQLRTPEDYASLLIPRAGSTPIPLTSVAKVVEAVENDRLAGWANDHRAVLAIVFKQAGANVIETVDRLREALPEIRRWLPPGIHVEPISDRTVTIRSSVNEVQMSLLLSIALVVGVIFLFLRRFWPTFIASVTVPLALAGTFGAMYLLDYSLDNLSLMAITVSVGFVVDDAIVVIENVHRLIESGQGTMAAAFEGARQIGFTIISMSVSLVAVFIPLLFMGGLIGRLFHEFAVTLSLAILISGVISLTLTPMLCSRFLKPEAGNSPPGRFHRACEAGFDAMLGVYDGMLRAVLRHQALTLLVAALTLAATVWLYVETPKGFFPQQDTGLMICNTEAAQDVSFPAMAVLQRKVARMVQDDPAVESVASFIGAAGGNNTVNNGRMFISLKPLAVRKASAEEIIARLRPRMGAVAGISSFLLPVQDIRVGGRGSKAQYQYALQSGNLDELNYWSARFLEKLRQIPQLREANTDQLNRGLQASVSVDREAAARLGVTVAAVDNTLYDAFGQRQIATLYDRFYQRHVILEVTPELQKDPGALSRLFVPTTGGKQAPLAALARFPATNSSLSVNHQGQFAAVTLSFNLAPGVSLGEATDLVAQAAEELHMPASVQGSFQGTAQVFQASLSSTPVLLIAALVTVYVVLGILYESLIHPITILSTLPSAGVGALLALLLFGFDLSLVSFIGIILLMGIVKKNAILMIDFALEAERRDGMPPEQAIYQACVIRFRPIMMTTMAALLGALPLAVGLGVGAELRRPLGVAVVGGLIVSQMLTLFTTPVIYLAFERLRLASRRWFGRAAKPLAAQPQPAQ